MHYAAPTAESLEAFHQGTSCRAYEMFGGHPCNEGGVKKWHFALWAPNAKCVSLVGDFNQWNKIQHPMYTKLNGIWEISIPDSEIFTSRKEDDFTAYQYAILGADDIWRMKADPFSFFMEACPRSGSRLYDMQNYTWGDSKWLEQRKGFHAKAAPVNIYEVHIGSWRRHEDGTCLSYTELADKLIPYVLEMGYTHVEFLPVMEHCCDETTPCRITGFFSAASRFGTPDDLRQLIDRCHQAGIGIILDWNPAWFPRNEAGLYKLDGTDLYNSPDLRRGGTPEGNVMLFDFSRGEICSFLLSSVCFWLDCFHADGIRVGSIDCIIDHQRESDEFFKNQYGGQENLEGLDFLRRMNQTVCHVAPGSMMIASESTPHPLTTFPAYAGGLGFGFKWNTVWMNDILSYIQLDPVYRKYHHDRLTSSLRYVFCENGVLPFPHSEVLPAKRSMLDKNPGDLWNKFAGLRALYAYAIACPGKKLLFMGGELAQFIEWAPDHQLDWFLLQYERHRSLQQCVKALNHLYRDHSPLYEADDPRTGFQWVTANDSDNSIAAFIRTDVSDASILCVTNFTPVFHPVYKVPLPYGGTLHEIFNSDKAEFGGSNQFNAYEIHVQQSSYHGYPFYAELCVPPLSTVFLAYDKILPPC